MPKLTSKLQYRNFEKGEFIDEEQRALQETLVLIKNYPWEEQRHLTDVQPTCPSVTIERQDSTYLKVGPGFNGKFCMYLLNSRHQLFEAYIAKIDEVCDMVIKFFNGANLEHELEKHTLSLSASGHFKTKIFEYRFSETGFFLKYSLLCLFTIVFIALLFLNAAVTNPIPILFIFIILFAALLIPTHMLMLNHYKHSKDACLNLSRGNDSFVFGVKKKLRTYYKSQITSLIIYSGGIQKGKQNQCVYQITFNDSSYIKISGMVIPVSIFAEKFPTVEIIEKTKWWPMM